MTDSIHEAAAGIFDILPDDPFGDEELEETAGTEEEREDSDLTGEEADDEEELEDDEVALEDDEAEESDEPEDEDEEEYEEEAEEEEGPEMFDVRSDGQDEQVSLDELKSSWSRTSSWTRKSQKLAQERKTFESEMVAVREERAQAGGMLLALEQQLQANMPVEPTGDDPKEWVQYQREQGRLAQVQSERRSLDDKIRTDYEATREAQIDDERMKLAELVPEWSDAAVAKKENAALVQFALGLGFTEEDMSNVTDHRIVMLFRQAKAFADLDDAKKVVRKRTRKVKKLQPGQKSNRKSRTGKGRNSKRARAARETLRERGRVDDAAAVIFETLLDDE